MVENFSNLDELIRNRSERSEHQDRGVLTDDQKLYGVCMNSMLDVNLTEAKVQLCSHDL